MYKFEKISEDEYKLITDKKEYTINRNIDLVKEMQSVDLYSTMIVADFLAERGETYENTKGPVEKVVIGKVTEMKKHEDSEKLWICQVDVGQGEDIQIVTAAQNVFEGAYIPVVLDGGTVIDRHNHTVMKIKKGKLRGVESNGMLLAAGTDDGIVVSFLDDKIKNGTVIR